MSENSGWKPNMDEISNETRSSQETICQNDNGDAQRNISASVLLFHHDATIQAEEEQSFKGEGMFVLQEDEISINATSSNALEVEPPMVMDEDTRMVFGNEPTMESPRDIISPGDPEDASSPFEAMESDVDSVQSASNIAYRRPLPPDNFHHMSTTTPGGSSDDEYSAGLNINARIKRRKKHVRNGDGLSYWNGEISARYNSPASSQIPSPSLSVTDHWAAETEDSSACPTPFLGKHNISYNNSDSNIHATINASRRHSNASEASLNTSSQSRDPISASVIKTEVTDTLTLTNSGPTRCRRLFKDQSQGVDIQNSEIVYKGPDSFTSNYPISQQNCTLEIVVQPESQHRARYLTEGSRGPVKDSSQQGFPQIKVKGYSGKATLHIFVVSENIDRLRPHGFYQACKVSGRNTSPCEEIDVDGTIVISMVVDTSEVISVDCVGILKLRNADVEARFGLQRAKKRSQNVRLVFRIFLHDLSTTNTINYSNPCVLQVVSNRINCTQPPGHPEIIKKSLDRGSVEGGAEMFIIGRNFRKGIKVIFQDPEEADGSHWSAIGQVDRNTFNQAHVVVEVPPYHDQKISKPVNVQVYIEYSRRKCDPHSFTYDPVIQKPVVTAAANPLPATVNNGNNPAVAVAAAASIAISNNGGSTSMNVAAAAASMNSESGDNSVDCHMKKFLSSVADRKKLVAWFSELLMSADIDSAEGGGAPTKMQGISAKDEAAVFASMCPTAEVTDTKSEPPPVSLPNQPVAFTQAVPKTTPVEKPTPKVAAGVDVINSSFPSSSIVTSRPLAPSSFTNQFGVHSKLSTNNPISSNNAAFNPQSVFASNSAAASATIVAPKSESLFCFGSNQTQGSFPFSAVVSGGNNNGDNNNSSNTFSITTINNNTTTNVVNDIMDNNSQSAVSVSTSVASIIEQPSVSNSAVTSMITDDDVNSMSSWQPQSQSTINLSQAGINTASSTTSLVKASTLKPLFQTQISSNKMSTTADEVMTFINTTPTAAFDDTSQSAWTRQEQQQQQRQQHKQNDTDQQMMHVQNQTPQQNLNQNTQVFQQQPQQIQLGHIFQQSNVHQQQQQQQPQFVNSQQQGSQQQQQPTHLFKQQQQHQSFVTNQQQQTNNIQQQQTNNIQQQTNNIQQQQQTNNIQQQTNNIQQPNQQQQNVNQLQQQQFHQQQQAGGQFQQQQQQQPTHMQQQHFQQQNPQQQQQRFQPQQTLVKPQTSQQQQQQNQVSQPQFTTITQLSTGGTGEMQVCGGQLPQIQQQQLSNLQQTQFLQQQQKPLQNNQQENNQQQQQFQQNHQQQQIGHNQQQQLILQQQQQLEDRLFQQQTSQHINIFGVTQKTTNSTGIPALSQSQVEQVLQQQQSFSSGPSAAQNQQQTVNSNIATTQQQQQNQQQSLMQQQTNNPITPSNQHQQQQQQQQQQRNLMMNDVMQRFTQLEQQSPFNNQQQSTSSNHCNSSAIATATSNTPEFVPSPSQNTIMFPMNNNSSAGDSRLQKSHSNISLESGMSAQLNHNEDTSPSRLMESGLSIGFDNHFTIDDNPAASVVKCNNLENVISSSTIDSVIASDPELHSFISDCNRSAHESDNIAAFRDLAPNRSSPANPDSSLFTSGSTNNVTSSDSCFITSNDVEMMDKQYEVGQQQSKQQQSQQSFLSQNHEGFNTNQQQDHQLSAFISHQQVVDTDMYLVDPNVVVKQIHSKHSSVANSPINNNSVSVANSSSATVGGSSPFMPGNESNNTVQSRQATSSPMVGTEEMRLSHPHQQQSQNMNTSVADESNVGGGGTGNDMSSVQPMHLSPLSQAKSQQLNSSTAFETINPCGVLKLEDDTSPRDYPSVSIQQQQQQQQQQQLPSNS